MPSATPRRHPCVHRHCYGRPGWATGFLGLMVAVCWAGAALASELTLHPGKANVIAFPAQDAKVVRIEFISWSGNAPCIDELEVYAAGSKRNVAAARCGGKASASSCINGYPIHRTEHLNDGRYGNDASWIAAGSAPQWAQVELTEPLKVDHVVLSRDRHGNYADRMPGKLRVRLSTDGKTWRTVKELVCRSAKVAAKPKGPRHAPPHLPGVPPPPKSLRGPSTSVLQVAETNAQGLANLALNPKAEASASSCLAGHDKHRIPHLNDGYYGNSHSWISDSDPSWAEIDLGAAYWIYAAAFGSDNSGQYSDRAATKFKVLVATTYSADSTAPTWSTVWQQKSGHPVHTRAQKRFQPVRARWIRVAIAETNGTNARIDEIEVFGQAEPIPAEKVKGLDAKVVVDTDTSLESKLRDAFLGEEHAWLKTHGRADLSPRLVPYNGRVKEYPRHVADDRLPLPWLAAAPQLDGKLDDACYTGASRGVGRVAYPYDFERGPLVACAATAGWRGQDVYLAIEVDRLLSRRVAVISGGDWAGGGELAIRGHELVFNTYTSNGKLAKRQSVDGGFSRDYRRFEVRLPMAWFPGCREHGLRIGLGMGGKHTDGLGRAVLFTFSSLAMAEASPCIGGTFRVRLSVPDKAKAVVVTGNAPGLTEATTLRPGESKLLEIPTEDGPIGPEFALQISEADGAIHLLHLFRYDPTHRTLTMMDELANRLAAQGVDVRADRGELAKLKAEHERLMARTSPDRTAERELFFHSRLAKRQLYFKDPSLACLDRVLFVKRRPFEPSHNYSVLLDSRYRPGGGVCVLETPVRDGVLDPNSAHAVTLFDSGKGIARNPMAGFDAKEIYFGYRPSKDGYYHILRMRADGSRLEQITDGPYHDYWPCPLPGGDLAMISTRCKARYLCWRPQVSVMFRMTRDGETIRPLSYSNLSEWAPSVMDDGRIIWTRSEYIDKGADFGHTLWAIRPDGRKLELIFGNTIIQPNGYANGREVPGTSEICCTLISHFGDLNGPITFIDINKGRFNQKAIKSLTPEVPWPGNWPREECFRDPVPVTSDVVLCSHAPARRFGLFLIDRYGHRELLYTDATISSMCPTLLRPRPEPPVLAPHVEDRPGTAEIVLLDVYDGISPTIERGRVKYIRVVEEVRSDLVRLPNGEYRHDHPDFIKWYASPIDLVKGPFGWPSYVAKAPHGLVPVREDGSARFVVPAGKTLYFQALDETYTELQRMRSVVQLQPGETRSCIGCHEGRHKAPPAHRRVAAMHDEPVRPQVASWGGVPLFYEKVVQPVLDAKCVRCHDTSHERGLDLRGVLDKDHIPASYKTLIRRGLVHFADCGWNSGGCEKLPPLSLGSAKSRLCEVLSQGHHEVKLTRDEMRRIKTWIDMNCPLWGDYTFRPERPGQVQQVSRAD